MLERDDGVSTGSNDHSLRINFFRAPDRPKQAAPSGDRNLVYVTPPSRTGVSSVPEDAEQRMADALGITVGELRAAIDRERFDPA